MNSFVANFSRIAHLKFLVPSSTIKEKRMLHKQKRIKIILIQQQYYKKTKGFILLARLFNLMLWLTMNDESIPKIHVSVRLGRIAVRGRFA
jgi:hypothetical protein